MFIQLFVAFWVLFLVYHLYWKRRGLPPGPIPLPFLGNILQFDIANTDKQLLEYRNRYGKLFTLWLPEPYVFFGNYEMMKNYFRKEEFSSRPVLQAMNLFVGGSYGLALNENSWWRSQRRFSLHVLRDFGVGKPILENACVDEARKLVANLQATNQKPCRIQPFLLTSVGNIIHQLVFGFTREHDDPVIHEIEHDAMITVDFFNSPLMFLMEQFPPVKHIDKIVDCGLKRVLEANDRILDKLQEEIDRHKTTLNLDEPPRDYIDSFLFEMEKRRNEGNLDEFSEHQLKISLYDLFFAGLETTVTTLRHAILHILRNPDIQAKIHNEIDRVLGRETEIRMKDQTLLPYLNATLQEVQRISNVVVLNLPHATTEDVTVDGYRIPKNTIVMPQYQIVHVDPKEFDHPDEFRPERFLDSEGNFVKDDRVIPFSIGKRACLGEGVARMELFIYFATMLQKFQFLSEIDGDFPPLDFKVAATKEPKKFNLRAIPRV